MRRIRNLALAGAVSLLVIIGLGWIFRAQLAPWLGVNVDGGSGGVADLQVPEGYAASVFADGLDNPRFLAVSPDGVLFVAERGARAEEAVRAERPVEGSLKLGLRLLHAGVDRGHERRVGPPRLAWNDADLREPGAQRRLDPDPGPTVAASAVVSTVPGGWGYAQGTSMASPQAAGVAALIVSQYGKLDSDGDVKMPPQQVESYLQSTAVDIGERGYDECFGNGRVDALRAVQHATSVVYETTPPCPEYEEQPNG